MEKQEEGMKMKSNLFYLKPENCASILSKAPYISTCFAKTMMVTLVTGWY